MNLIEIVSKRINELLEENKMTPYKLFKNSGVAQSSISNIRQEKYNSVDLRTVLDIAQGLGIDLRKFFDSPLFDGENIAD